MGEHEQHVLERGRGCHLSGFQVQPLSNQDERVKGVYIRDAEIVEKSLMLISVGGNKSQGGLDSWAVMPENDSDAGFAGRKMNTHAGTPQRHRLRFRFQTTMTKCVSQ